MPCSRNNEILKDTTMPCSRNNEILKDTIMPCGRNNEILKDNRKDNQIYENTGDCR